MKLKMIESISCEKIKSSLELFDRIYLSGDFEFENDVFKKVQDKLEIGISQYDEYTVNEPHYHISCDEHSYIISGGIKVRIFNDDDAYEDYEYGEGDFVVIRANTRHVVKNKAGTKILFIKLPNGLDKYGFELDDDTKLWLESWD